MVDSTLNMNKESLQKVLCNDLNTGKVCVNTVTKCWHMTKKWRVGICTDLIGQTGKEPDFLTSITMGSQYNTKTNRQSLQCTTNSHPQPKKVKTSSSKLKSMWIVFFGIKGHAPCTLSSQTHRWCGAIKRKSASQRPGLWSHKSVVHHNTTPFHSASSVK